MTPQELKYSILQQAIQGNLVEQRPEEGTAEELYQQIQAEKQRLIKEKKIKKDKPLPEITDDEKPFEIPDSWKWVRLGSVISLLSGQDLASTQYNDTYKGIPYITGASNFLDEKLLINRWTEFGRNIAHKGDLLLTCKGTVGKTHILYEDEVHIARQVMSLSVYILNLKFIKYLIENNVPVLKSKAKSMIPGIERSNVLTLPIPLPPLAEQKRIVAKIEELLPLIDRYEAAWTKLEALNKRFPEDMQKSIIQQAIQGKLVEQRPEEGTAEELYQQIQAEKQRLIKEKKIKKDKPLREITDDEKPFEIPENWKWVRLGDIATVQSSKRVFEKDYVESGVPFFRSKEIGDLSRGEQIQTRLFITHEHYEQLKANFGVPRRGDILITSVGTIGNTWICDDREFYYKDGNITQIVKNEHLDPEYVKLYLASPLFFSQALSTVSGTAYSALTIIKLKSLILPLPPLAEQKRIVAKIEQLLPLCEKLKFN